MRRDSAIAVAVAILAVSVPVAAGAAVPDRAGGPASAADGTHGNHVSVDPQVSADGTVVLETVSTTVPGFVVLRADDGGEPGEPVGHTFVERPSFRTDVTVAVDDATWRDWEGNETLWAVLHADDGDGEFDPATDESLERQTPSASAVVAVGRGDRSVRVLTREFGARRLDDGALTVRRVDLARDGYLVATADDEVVGTTPLSPGTHENVTLGLDESFLAAQSDRFRLRLTAYRDDGDGEFGPADRPVRVGDDPVATTVTVDNPTGSEGPHDGTTTSTPADESQSATPSPTPTAGAATTAPATDGGPTGTTDATATGPGFGGLLAGVAVALTATALLAVGRRR